MQTISNVGEFIDLKDDDWLKKQRYAGRVVAKTLSALEDLVKTQPPKTLLEYDRIAEEIIVSENCRPTFKGYPGHNKYPFPNAVCISVNRALVHGVPNFHTLQNGDLVSFDLGATFEGAIADSALTIICGQPISERHVELVKTTEECLLKAIESIEMGKQVGCIGETIFKIGRNKGFSVIDTYGGHGLSKDKAHANPFISNRSESNKGVRIQPNMTIAIEPLLCLGSNKTFVGDDKWTVFCDDLCAHFEHTIFIHEDGKVEIITER